MHTSPVRSVSERDSGNEEVPRIEITVQHDRRMEPPCSVTPIPEHQRHRENPGDPPSRMARQMRDTEGHGNQGVCESQGADATPIRLTLKNTPCSSPRNPSSSRSGRQSDTDRYTIRLLPLHSAAILRGPIPQRYL